MPRSIIDLPASPAGTHFAASIGWVRQHPALILAVTVVGVAGLIRFHDLAAKSFWFDEILTAHVTRIEKLDELGAWIEQWIDHPPFQLVLTWLLRGLGGDEFAVRLPVAIAGTLAVAAMYALGSSLFRPLVGLIAASLLATMSYAVWYSQEARPYAFVLLWTILQMLFAHRAATRARGRDWAALVAVSALSLYTSYLALATTAVVAGFIGMVAIWRLWSVRKGGAVPLGDQAAVIDPRTFLATSVVSFGLIGLIYSVWVPHLMTFLSRPDLGFGRIDTAHTATLAEVSGLLRSVSLGDASMQLLIIVAAVGLVADRGSRRGLAAGLIGMWLLVGLGGLIIRTGGGVVTIWPRYFVYLVPAGVLLVAVGADYATRAVQRMSTRTLSRIAGLAVPSAIVVVLLAPAPATLTELYATPKGDDYRGAAAWIAARAGKQPVALAIGDHPDWLVLGLSHELWLAGAPDAVFDADRLDAAAFDALASAGSVVVASAPEPAGGPVPAGWSGYTVQGIGMIRIAASPGSALGLAETGLRWANPMNSDIATSMRLLGAVGGIDHDRSLLSGASTGSGSGSGSGTWSLSGGWTLDGNGDLRLTGQGQQSDAVVDVPAAGVATLLALTFECRSSMSGGSLRLYVSAHSADGSWLTILPTGAGYTCPSDRGLEKGGFVITVPAGTAYLSVRVRSDGVGDGEVRNLRMVVLPGG